MKRLLTTSSALLLGLAFCAPARADGLPSTVLTRAMKDELARTTSTLEMAGMPRPYFVSYAVTEDLTGSATARFGALVHSGVERSRRLAVRVRVGDESFDNGNFYGGGRGTFGGSAQLPIEDDYDTLRRALWLATDEAYKGAIETLQKKRADKEAHADATDKVDSFSKEPRNVVTEGRPPEPVDLAALEGLSRTLSAVFRDFPLVQTDWVSARVSQQRQTFLSTEGTFTDETARSVQVRVTCEAQADDGMRLSDYVGFAGRTSADLPPAPAMLAEVRRVAAELGALRGAPMVDDFEGPVLFEGLAGPQLVRDVLAPRLSGTPPMAGGGGASAPELLGKIGLRVMAPGLSVDDDPTVDHLGAALLVGGYKADDEGVVARKVTLVRDGILETLLMSRTPAKGLPRSNGHGQGHTGDARGQLANLLVTAKGGLPAGELRRRLAAEVKAAHVPYGLVVKLLGESGDAPPRPVVMLKVTPDGKEQLVRGAQFGTVELRALKDIVAAGKDPVVLSGAMSGTRRGSGAVWASVAAPALLVKELEVKKPTGQQKKPPSLAHPYFGERKPTGA